MIIGIVGFINSGKGEVGDFLHREFRFKRDSFAKPLKDAVSIIFGWDRDMLEGNTEKSRKQREEVDSFWSMVTGREITPRLVLQIFATECVRNIFHQNTWTASLIKRNWNHDADVVITDCRFKNEMNAIRKAGGLIIRVKRGANPEWYNEMIKFNNGEKSAKVDDLRKSGQIPHISETDWIGYDFDYTLFNNGTLKELHEEIEKLMFEIFENERDVNFKANKSMNGIIDYFGG
jgi:hypothetical protein